MNKLFGALGLMIMAGSIPALAQQVGVGYKSDGSDVSGDFAEAEGDGASVSADVTVGFNIGKKIAIAIKQPDGGFTNNPLFHPPSGFDSGTLPTPTFWIENPDLSPHSSLHTNLTKSGLSIIGAIYSNTDVSITCTPSESFVNEDDPSSIIKGRHAFLIQKQYGGNSYETHPYDDDNSSTSVFPSTANIPVTAFADNGGVLVLRFWTHMYRDTIDATDRSGNYYSNVTFTVAAM